ESIMIKRYPTFKQRDLEAEKTFGLVIEAIVGIRRAKANIELGNKKIENASIKLENKELLEDTVNYISLLAKVENISFVNKKLPNSASDISDNLEVYIPLSGVDLSPIKERLNNQKTKLEKEIAKLNAMLGNERFVANAPKEVVETNRATLEDAKIKFDKIEKELEELN
ncbi:MAG: valine--tRNA ligase, partial [Campylobacteraceae bacterium]|nr:valine--tRNA ligase [Campylobacteraceae bacterium]